MWRRGAGLWIRLRRAMAQKTKVPDGCADLNLAEVSRVLVKHHGDITSAAKELRVYAPDLRRLTWAHPEVLEAAEDLCGEITARAEHEVISALWSDDPRRQRWGCDRILSSHLAKDSPLAPAGRAMAGRACVEPACRVQLARRRSG
jgi:hypothetical protein